MDCDRDYVVLIYGVVEDMLVVVVKVIHDPFMELIHRTFSCLWGPINKTWSYYILFWLYYYILHWIAVLVMCLWIYMFFFFIFSLDNLTMTMREGDLDFGCFRSRHSKVLVELPGSFFFFIIHFNIRYHYFFSFKCFTLIGN